MSASEISPGERVKDVHFAEDTFSVDLADGRTITVPYAWYPRLLHASAEQLANWQTCGGGYGIHWPDLDEDLSTEGCYAVRLPGQRQLVRNPPHLPTLRPRSLSFTLND